MTNIFLKKLFHFSSDQCNGEIYYLSDLNDFDEGNACMRIKENNKIKKNLSQTFLTNRMYVLKGNYTGELPVLIYFLAANPPNSFYGSSAVMYTYPFPNQTIAFENTPSHAVVRLDSKRDFEIQFLPPNSFYTSNGSTLEEPKIYLKFIHFKTIQKDARDDPLIIPVNSLNAKTFMVKIQPPPPNQLI